MYVYYRVSGFFIWYRQPLTTHLFADDKDVLASVWPTRFGTLRRWVETIHRKMCEMKVFVCSLLNRLVQNEVYKLGNFRCDALKMYLSAIEFNCAGFWLFNISFALPQAACGIKKTVSHAIGEFRHISSE